MLVIKVRGDASDGIDISEEAKTQMKKDTTNLSSTYLTWLLNTLIKEESTIQYAAHTKTAVEMVLLKLLEIRKGADVDRIISKLNELTKQNVSRTHLGPETKESPKPPVQKNKMILPNPAHLTMNPKKKKTTKLRFYILSKNNIPSLVRYLTKEYFQKYLMRQRCLNSNHAPVLRLLVSSKKKTKLTNCAGNILALPLNCVSIQKNQRMI